MEKEIHGFVHRTCFYYEKSLDIVGQSRLLYLHTLACRQDWPLKTPFAEEIEHRVNSAVRSKAFDGNVRHLIVMWKI